MGTFAASVGNWCKAIPEALEIVFKEAAQEVVSELNALVPVDTGALRASLRASTSVMPQILAEGATPPGDMGEIMLVIEGADIGDTIFLGYTMNYSSFVHYGANGRPGRPWVDMVSQRWNSIVQSKASEVKSRLGL